MFLFRLVLGCLVALGCWLFGTAIGVLLFPNGSPAENLAIVPSAAGLFVGIQLAFRRVW
jgi:hypothetical protein